MMTCNRYNITRDDVFRGVNDTTNSALLTGREIAGGRTPAQRGTTCHMHAQELVVTHALGLGERSKAGVVTDQYEAGKNIRNKVKNLLSKIMDKKAKGRFKEYKMMCQEYLHCNAPKLELPNDTRVSGVFRMYQSALR
jgi:hypothetical protein